MGKPDPLNLVCFLGGRRYMCVSHSTPIIQMFQTPALIVMTIAATRMHRSFFFFFFNSIFVRLGANYPT